MHNHKKLRLLNRESAQEKRRPAPKEAGLSFDCGAKGRAVVARRRSVDQLRRKLAYASNAVLRFGCGVFGAPRI